MVGALALLAFIAVICAWVTLVAIVGLLAYVIGVMAVRGASPQGQDQDDVVLGRAGDDHRVRR